MEGEGLRVGRDLPFLCELGLDDEVGVREVRAHLEAEQAAVGQGGGVVVGGAFAEGDIPVEGVRVDAHVELAPRLWLITAGAGRRGARGGATGDGPRQ